MTHKFYKTKKSITNWLKSMDIINYTLVPNEEYDFVVDVAGTVNLSNEKLKYIPVKFNIVKDSFICSHNSLTSLIGSPVRVGGDFMCSSNLLENLEGSPQIVGHSFWAPDNKLVSLFGMKTEIGLNLLLMHNSLSFFLHTTKPMEESILIDSNPHPISKKETITYEEMYDQHIIDCVEYEKKIIKR